MKKDIRNLIALFIFFALGFSANISSANVAPINHNTLSMDELVGGAYLTFAGKFGGDVTRKDLSSHDAVEVSGCAKGSKIFQFTLYVTKKGKTTSFQTKSSNLTSEMVSHLKTLSPGDEFEFKRIKANLPKGDGVVDVHSKKFYVV